VPAASSTAFSTPGSRSQVVSSNNSCGSAGGCEGMGAGEGGAWEMCGKQPGGASRHTASY
jgi:hypothetical protein